MVFSSVIFIFVFLPFCVIGYYLFPKRARNVFLLLASLIFYAWGEPVFVLVLLAATIVNWGFGIAAEICAASPSGKVVVTLAVVFNLSILFTYKYLGFVAENLERLLGRAFDLPSFVLPIGLSFCTFQAISYIVDVYRGRSPAQKNPLNAMLYILMFPQLTAGPIVRYETVAAQLTARKVSLDDFVAGLRRFILGLAKKTLLANTFAIHADNAFAAMPSNIAIAELLVPEWAETVLTTMPENAIVAWGGILAYTLQIYFDFSAYSDMAIGLGAMFGFKFPENFNYPYVASSVTDFWRRWHISLGMWFRDYVYFPLGGSRVKSRARLVFNLFVVWTLTGVWHGAGWTFIAWGLMYFVLLTLEKLGKIPQRLKEAKNGAWRGIYRLFTLLAVIAGWVFFRANDFSDGLGYLKAMFNPIDTSGKMEVDWDLGLIRFVQLREAWIQFTDIYWLLAAVVVGLLFATPYARIKGERLAERLGKWGLPAGYAVSLLLYIASIAVVIASNYNPFIYFNF
ncbi:MAG: MBOAT family protein [Lachnospiraceae bacterium]|jgi:alginate O-acetyltransferase complex protein AlgI|nr:MBOAT family protein [Lachnospiraceae bacterium]